MVVLEVQFITFIYMMIIGFILAWIFDFYRALRSFGYLQGLISQIIDFSFCMIAGVIVFITLLRSNWGEIRFYVFLGLLVGIIIYNRLLSSLFLKIFRALWARVFKIFNRLVRFIKRVYKFLKDLFLKLSQLLFKIKSKLGSFLEK